MRAHGRLSSFRTLAQPTAKSHYFPVIFFCLLSRVYPLVLFQLHFRLRTSVAAIPDVFASFFVRTRGIAPRRCVFFPPRCGARIKVPPGERQRLSAALPSPVIIRNFSAYESNAKLLSPKVYGAGESTKKERSDRVGRRRRGKSSYTRCAFMIPDARGGGNGRKVREGERVTTKLASRCACQLALFIMRSDYITLR